MQRRLFNAWCAVCLFVTAVLLASYVLDTGVAVAHASVAPGNVRRVEMLAGRGRLRCFIAMNSGGVPLAQAGFHVDARVHFAKPRFDAARFDSHWIARPGSPGGSLYLVASPLWFAMIVALVSPVIWFIGRRRCRRRECRDAPGFAVVTTTAPTRAAAGAEPRSGDRM